MRLPPAYPANQAAFAVAGADAHRVHRVLVSENPPTDATADPEGTPPQRAAAAARPDTLAIIVTWNKEEVLDRMLETLAASESPGTGSSSTGAGFNDAGDPVQRPFDVLLIDNASTDGTVAMVREKYPWVEVLEHAENLGGTGGFNAGMREGLHRGYPYLWLMDNDIIIHPGAFTALRAAMDSDRRIGLVGSHVLYLENPERTQEVGSWVDWKTGKLRQFDKDALNPGPHLNDIGFASACCTMARAAAVRQVGIWDPGYFIAFDDVDWGVRLDRGGWRLVGTTEARVEHASYFSRRPKQGLVSFYYSVRNCMYFFRRHGRTRDNIGLFYHHLKPVIGDALAFRAAGKKEWARALYWAVADFFKNRMGKCTHTFNFGKAESGEQAWPKIKQRKRPNRLLLVGAMDRGTIEGQIELLEEHYPAAEIDVFIPADYEELIAADVPRAFIAPFGSAFERLKFLISNWGRWDAVFALEVVRHHLFEDVIPHRVRLDPDGYPVSVQRGGVWPFVKKALLRIASSVIAAPLAVAATFWPMKRPDYFTFDTSPPEPRVGNSGDTDSKDGSEESWSIAPRLDAKPAPHSQHRRSPLTYLMALVNYAFVAASILVLAPIMSLKSRRK